MYNTAKKSKKAAARQVAAASGEPVRDQVLHAALALFRKKGYLGTSMTDIAVAVGLTKGGIYHYIQKKEDLLFELHDQMVDSVEERYERDVATQPDPAKRLVNWIEMHASVMHDYQDQITVFLNEFDHLDRKSIKGMIERRDRLFKNLEELISDGIKKGEFRRGIDPEIAAFLIMGAVNWFHRWYRQDGRFSMAEITRMTIDVFCHGICK